ncbi:MAG: iron-sulfur cluster assembly scaffold protein [Clostridia bacterium]|nr:iron-sulfur cluster assembly scaffold protein [Clostridia bacterium]
MYSNVIMEEFYNPQNYGVIKGASGVGKVTSAIGNEIIKIFIKVESEAIVDAQFQTFGGVVAIAASSIATRLMIGKTLKQIRNITVSSILEVTGEIPENKMYIIQAVVSAVHASVDSYFNKSAKDD